jgi:hypothetical protein
MNHSNFEPNTCLFSQMLTNPWMMTTIFERTGNTASCQLSSMLQSIRVLFKASWVSGEAEYLYLNGGDIMDKNERVYFLIVVVAILFVMGVFHLISPEDKPDNNSMYILMPVAETINDADPEPRYISEMNLIAGICALLLVGYLFRSIYRKFKTDSQADQIAMDNSLYPISLATGRTEYNLFRKSAEEWAVSGDRIDQDFKRYMADMVLPYYAKDFVRKNRTQIDESLIKKRETKPTSWLDWVKALLVFPGSLLFLFSISFLLG